MSVKKYISKIHQKLVRWTRRKTTTNLDESAGDYLKDHLTSESRPLQPAPEDNVALGPSSQDTSSAHFEQLLHDNDNANNNNSTGSPVSTSLKLSPLEDSAAVRQLSGDILLPLVSTCVKQDANVDNSFNSSKLQSSQSPPLAAGPSPGYMISLPSALSIKQDLKAGNDISAELPPSEISEGVSPSTSVERSFTGQPPEMEKPQNTGRIIPAHNGNSLQIFKPPRSSSLNDDYTTTIGDISDSRLQSPISILVTQQLQTVSGIPPVLPQKTIIMKNGIGSLVVDRSTHTVIGGNNNIVYQDNTQNTYDKAISNLHQYTNHNAELDSNARYPAPECYPGTRKRLISEVMEWLSDGSEHRGKQVLWLHGVAGSGKSAFAQTLAEHVKEKGMLGGTFFFSKSDNRNDASLVFPTIAYRLTVTDNIFRSEIGKVVAGDRVLLQSNFEVLFEKLIARPLRQVQTKKKFLIILDGLDQCEGIRNQTKMVEKLVEAVEYPPLPVVWMICSRPESHLKRLFHRANIREFCWTEELSVCSQEAKEDLELYIRYTFKRIRRKNPDTIDSSNWPGEDILLKIIRASSGQFSFFATIERFIDNDDNPNPEDLLEKVMERLEMSDRKGIMSKDPLEILSDL